jgi:hypothetical protein
VVPNQRINFLCSLHCRCRGWSAAAGPITNFLFTSLKTTGPASNWANIYGIITIHVSQTSINLNRTGAFRSTKVNPHCLLSTYDHNLRHFALLLWWTRVTDWSTDDRGRAWQCRCPLSKGWNSTRRTFKRKESGMTFVPTFLETKCDGCLYSRTGL